MHAEDGSPPAPRNDRHGATARELAPLRAVRDNYPKTLLTLDRVGVGDHGGIRQENVIDWMLGRAAL